MVVDATDTKPLTSNPILASVIVPAYNAENYVEGAIRSALAQSEGRIEVLVVDDCSTDATADVVKSIAQEDGRVRLLQVVVNSGPAAARNVGLETATGRWIALLDADDLYETSRLKQLIGVGESLNADIVSDNLLLCPEGDWANGEIMIPKDLLSRPTLLTAAEFVRRNVGTRQHSRVRYGFLHPIIRRDFLLRHSLRYDEANRFGEDFMLYTRCLIEGAIWWMTPEATYWYNVRGGSLTYVQTSGDLNRIRSLERALLSDARVLADRELSQALRRHKRAIDRCYYYRAFTDAMKARHLRKATALLFDEPHSAGHILAESLAQAPTVITKALRGGYR